MLTVIVFALAFIASIASCAGSEEEEVINASNETTQAAQEATEPAQETTGDAASDVIMRVSGTPGTVYAGGYGTMEETQSVSGILGTEPTDYEEVKVKGEDEIAAVFRKTQPGDEGTLKVELLVEREVVAEGETSEQLGRVNINWSLPEGQKERVVPLD